MIISFGIHSYSSCQTNLPFLKFQELEKEINIIETAYCLQQQTKIPIAQTQTFNNQTIDTSLWMNNFIKNTIKSKALAICGKKQPTGMNSDQSQITIGKSTHLDSQELKTKDDNKSLSVYSPNSQNTGLNSISFTYHPKIQIIFSLFYEGSMPISWEINDILKEYFTPIRNFLFHIYDFNVDTQIQIYTKIPKDIINNNNNDKIRVIKDSNIFADTHYWNLKNIHSKKNLNFILYVPEINSNPLKFSINDNDDYGDNIIINERGGVVILNPNLNTSLDSNSNSIHLNKNDLIPIFETFNRQLFQLLGLKDFLSSKSQKVNDNIKSRIMINLAIKSIKTSTQVLNSLITINSRTNMFLITEKGNEDIKNIIELIEKSSKILKHQIKNHNNHNNYDEIELENALKFAQKSLLLSENIQIKKRSFKQAGNYSEYKFRVEYILYFWIMFIYLISGFL